MKGFVEFPLWLVVMVIFAVGCAPERFQTLKIFESRSRAVTLQHIPGANDGRGYEHPAFIASDELTRILKGIRVYRGSVSGGQPSASALRRAFSDIEIGLLVPHLVKGLQKATPEELVTFFETVEIDEDYELTTSGGMFVAAGNFHLILSNFSVKTPMWQDLDEAEGSYRYRPLEQMEAQPGGVVFLPQKYMTSASRAEFGSRLKGKPWQVSIRYKEFLKTKK